ncbi:histidine phosphatase family protein [Actinomycetospora aeridis]|uniref:Histidine phosphatase family protein n=1 Tax=Actinomycetospora aeridis TaxID=3129231 RepID=A0ABU8NEL8_9PSEU
MTDLVLARHGETRWHAENRYAGRTDVELAPGGHRQAEGLARWAAGAGLDAVITSPLRRARDTALPAAHAAGLTLRTDPRLVEVDFGEGDGHTREEMETLFPEALAAFLAKPSSSPLPGGETGSDAVERALPVLAAEVAARPDGRVLVVAHQTLLRLLLCHLLGLPLDHYRAVFPRLEGAARTVVRPAPHGPAALVALNVPCPAEPPGRA